MQATKQYEARDTGFRESRDSNMDSNKKEILDAKVDSNFDGKRMRKTLHRRTIDYYGAIARGIEFKMSRMNFKSHFMKADPSYISDLLVPMFSKDKSVFGVSARFVQQAQNKIRCPVNIIRWTPEGRRILTGSSSGEFTLWNGLTFNFETIMQAHDTAIRGMEWSHDSQWLISGDQGGIIKYWQPNMNNVKAIQAHKEAIRDLSFCPSDVKFVSASDDSTLKVWDFTQGQEEAILTGHGWDVKCVDWHPSLGLIASGSKDNMIKLWDPRSRQCLNTLHGHNNTILGLKWNKNGWWLLSGSRDSNLQVFDIRKMDNFISFKGISKEVTSVAWHPVYETMLASGCSDGSLMMWDTNNKDPIHTIQNAHESYVWSIDWHPVGHLLASGSNDHTTRFWARSRPGDYLKKTQFDSTPPLPPGATNASSLLHDSSAASAMQGHHLKSGDQNKTVESSIKLDISDLLKRNPVSEIQKAPIPSFSAPQTSFISRPSQNGPVPSNFNATVSLNNFQQNVPKLQNGALPGLGGAIPQKNNIDYTKSFQKNNNEVNSLNLNGKGQQLPSMAPPPPMPHSFLNCDRSVNHHNSRRDMPQYPHNNSLQKFTDKYLPPNSENSSKHVGNNYIGPYANNRNFMIPDPPINSNNSFGEIAYRPAINDLNTMDFKNMDRINNSTQEENLDLRNRSKKHKPSHP